MQSDDPKHEEKIAGREAKERQTDETMELKPIQGRLGSGAGLVERLAELAVGDEAPSHPMSNAGPHLHRDECIDKRHPKVCPTRPSMLERAGMHHVGSGVGCRTAIRSSRSQLQRAQKIACPWGSLTQGGETGTFPSDRERGAPRNRTIHRRFEHVTGALRSQVVVADATELTEAQSNPLQKKWRCPQAVGLDVSFGVGLARFVRVGNRRWIWICRSQVCGGHHTDMYAVIGPGSTRRGVSGFSVAGHAAKGKPSVSSMLAYQRCMGIGSLQGRIRGESKRPWRRGRHKWIISGTHGPRSMRGA
jgi:hypothetical protein